MTKFDPQSKVKKIQGKDYLEVKWRIVWFREVHPDGAIETAVAGDDLMKAVVRNGEGHILATGHGSSKKQGVASKRPFEVAETAAIGRALAHAGLGPQFTGEEEGDQLADAPVEVSLRDRYNALFDEAVALGIEGVKDYAIGQNTADDEIVKLGKELRAKVEKAGK
jgi:hypothetical protein